MGQVSIAYQVMYDWKILKSAKGTLFSDEQKKSPDAKKKMRPLIFDFWWYAGAYSGFSPFRDSIDAGSPGFHNRLQCVQALKIIKA
jgi:hypothetical protein